MSSRRGRPPGSKNKCGHNAGGDHRSEQFKDRRRSRSLSLGPHRVTNPSTSSANKQGATTSLTPVLMLSAAEREAKYEEGLEQTRTDISRAFNHPSNRYGVAGIHSSAEQESLWLEDDGEEALIDKLTNDGTFDQYAERPRQRRFRPEYVPKTGSPKFEYLKQIKDKVSAAVTKKCGEFFIRLSKGLKWVNPEVDAFSVGFGRSPRPDRWYLDDCWVYIWHPTLQYKFLLASDKHPCAYCGECQTESKGWHYRLAHEFTREVFILHQRYTCNNPKCSGGSCEEEGGGASKTFATIDPKALSRLPTAVARRFDFLCLKGSIGVHLSLLEAFQCLSTQSDVLFQVFVNMLNEMKMRRYHRQFESYLDRLKSWTSQPLGLAYDGSAVPSYSAFGEAGHHNGMRMSVSLLKRCWIHASEVVHDYMQSSFQHSYDETLSADISFKLAKKVRAELPSHEKVRVMEGTLSMANGNGKICVSRGLHGKSHDAIAPTLSHVRDAREKSSAPALLQVNTDNPKADRALFEQYFPELRSGLTKVDPVSRFPYVYLQDHCFRFFNKKSDLIHYMITQGNEHVESLRPDSSGHVYYGLDAEWNIGTPVNAGLALLQLSFPGMPVLVLHVHKIGTIPPEIASILTNQKYVPCGRNITGDLNRLESHNVTTDYRVELGTLARALGSDSRQTSLSRLCQEYLGYSLANKDYGQHGNYETEELNGELIRYAATDALVSRLLAEEMRRRAAGLDSATLSGSNLLSEGSDVQIVCQRSIIADVTVVFIGNNLGLGGMRKFGNKSVGCGKAIVRINTIRKKNWKVPYGRDEGEKSPRSFKKGALLQDVFLASADKELLVNSCQLRLPLPDPSTEIEDLLGKKGDALLLEQPPDDEKPESPSEIPPEQSPRPLEQRKSSDAIVDLLQDSPTLMNSLAIAVTEEQGGSCEGATTRLKYDIFHQFDSMPLGRDSPIAMIAYWLIHAATFVKHTTDWLKVKDLLRRKLEIEGEEAVCEHEFFHRTFHRRRVRVSTPSAALHAGNIRAVHTHIRETDLLKEHYTKDLNHWLSTFEQRALSGWFEEIDGVIMYQHDGVDSDGLDLWLRNQGTSRLENYHQKLEGLVGSHTVGVEVADYLLVYRTFHYNVQTGIKRCGEPNLGHSDLFLFDRLQRKIQELFGIRVLPSHTNLSEFSPLRKDWVTVVPISAPPECVDLSRHPLPDLPADLSYMAKIQGVSQPPVAPATENDRKLVKQEFKKFPTKPTLTDLLLMCAEHKKFANGKDVFPKIPSMIASYYDQHKKNSALQLMLRSIGQPLSGLLSSLNKQTTAKEPETRQRESPGSRKDPLLDSPKQFIPPIQASYQKSEILVSQRSHGQESRLCAWYPECVHIAKDCGGYTLPGCRHLGPRVANDKKAEEDARIRIQRKRKEATDSLSVQTSDRDCAWWPLCTAGIKQCHGTKPAACMVFGTNGLLTPPEDFRQKYKTVRSTRNNFKKTVRKAIRTLNDHREGQPAAQKKCSTSTIAGTVESAEEHVWLENRVIVMDNKVYILGGPLPICGISIHTHDVFDLLRSNYTLINDQLVEAYLRLIRESSVGRAVGIGSVNTNFWSFLKQKHGWEAVKTWVRSMDSKAADWDSTPLIFIPIFSGPQRGGHWSNLIMDRSTLANEQNNSKTLFVYADSLGGKEMCREIRSAFEETTTLLAGQPNVSWEHASSPLQSGLDCGVWTCLKFAAWAHAASEGRLYEYRAEAECLQVEFGVTQDVSEWGRRGREHILRSFCDGAIDFHADVLKALHVKIILPYSQT